jgi:hypothetical protein
MSRKDYELLASELRQQYPLGKSVTMQRGYVAAVRAIAHALSLENSRFNMAKFLKAVGIID